MGPVILSADPIQPIPWLEILEPEHKAPATEVQDPTVETAAILMLDPPHSGPPIDVSFITISELPIETERPKAESDFTEHAEPTVADCTVDMDWPDMIPPVTDIELVHVCDSITLHARETVNESEIDADEPKTAQPHTLIEDDPITGDCTDSEPHNALDALIDMHEDDVTDPSILTEEPDRKEPLIDVTEPITQFSPTLVDPPANKVS